MKLSECTVIHNGQVHTLELLVPLSQEAIERATKGAQVEIQAIQARMLAYEQQLRKEMVCTTQR